MCRRMAAPVNRAGWRNRWALACALAAVLCPASDRAGAVFATEAIPPAEGPAPAQSSPAPAEDWPATIARLTQAWHRDSGSLQHRNQLATAYNNYAVELAGQGQWELALKQMDEAIRLNPDDDLIRKNLASIYLSRAYESYNNRVIEKARSDVDHALKLDPDLAKGYALLGELEYNSQRLKEAKAAWQRALELEPSLPELTERYERLVSELPVESKFERISQAYFELRYEEGLQRPTGFDIRDMLLDARRTVGSDFAYWPNRRLVVLLYSAESFRKLRAESPEWLGGQYDGKIRIPLPGFQLDVTAMKQILFHEYTHALVHDQTRGRCPVWFNEGLAEYEGARHGRVRYDAMISASQEQRLVPWEQLDHQFAADRPTEDVALAYQQSHTMARYLIERYGFWRIRRILRALSEGATFEQTLSDELHLKPQRLESLWLAWLPELFSRSSP